MRLSFIILLLLMFQTSCASQESYTSEDVNQDVVNEIEQDTQSYNLIELPEVVVAVTRRADEPEEATLDRFPFRPILDKPILPIVKPKVPPVSGDFDAYERIFDGDLIRKVKDSILQIIDTITSTISIVIYFIPIAILGYFGGALFGGIAATLYGIAYVRRAFLAIRSKEKE